MYHGKTPPADLQTEWRIAGLCSFLVGSLHELVGWFLGRVPPDHLPSANIATVAAAFGNGQFNVAHGVLRPAAPTRRSRESARGDPITGPTRSPSPFSRAARGSP